MRYYWLGCLLFLLACDGPESESAVVLSEPLPVGQADLPQFLPEHLGIYRQLPDTVLQFEVQPRLVLTRTWLDLGPQSRAVADSLQRAARDAAFDGQLRLLPARGDSARVLVLSIDTTFRLTAPTRNHLRRQADCYYLNRPGRLPGTWQTERWQLRGRQLRRATLTADTVRLAALHPARFRPQDSLPAPHYLIRPTTHNQTLLLHDNTLWQADTLFVRR